MTAGLNLLLLRIARVLLYLYLFAAALSLIFLAGKSTTALLSDNGAVVAGIRADLITIRVDTKRPHQLTALGEAWAGFDAGTHGRPLSSPYYITEPYQSGTSYALLPNSYEKLLRYPEPSGWKRLMLLNLGFTNDYLSLQFVVFLLLSALLLTRILRSVRRDNPFTAANAQRIWWLGILLIFTDVWQVFAYWLVRFIVPPFAAPNLAAPLNHYVVMNNELDYGGWLVGVILLLIAAIYQRGVELTQEAELTV